MTTNDQLAATTRYLRFPLAQDHRTALQDGARCPHCAGKRVQKWGCFSGRQRYRCCGCGRTFSTFTGTALHHLKRPDLWRRFLWCVDGRLTVRSSAAVLGLNKDTALRWRHRLLDQWRTEPRPRLNGRIVIGHFTMPQSEKGRRSLGRLARARGEPWSLPSFQTNPVTVLMALEDPARPNRTTAMIIEKVGVRRLRSHDYDDHIPPRVRGVTEIVGCRGSASPLATFARRRGVGYTCERRSFLPSPIFRARRQLRTWLRPFRGVSTRRLDNYLEWFRRRSRGSPGPPHRLQQFPRTEPYRLRASADQPTPA